MAEESYTLQDWINTTQVEYELTQEQLDKFRDTLAPAVALAHDLNIPFSFVYQGALKADGISCSLNGDAGTATLERMGPNMLLFHLLFMARTTIDPDMALNAISSAVQQKLDNNEEQPAIFIP
jgi:hypothetical protein